MDPITEINSPPVASQPAPPTQIADVGQTANCAASRHLFDDYRSDKADNTLTAQHYALQLYARYLEAIGIKRQVEQLERNPAAWAGTTWGIVKGFAKWLLREGYAVTTVNHALSTVRTYCRLASQAGEIPSDEMQQIKAVTGYSRKAGKRIDERRTHTHVSSRKVKHTSIDPDQIEALKGDHADTPQGRRDAVVMALLLDHGLQVGELIGLQVADVELDAGLLRFYRPKVDKEQTHQLTPDSLRALRACFEPGDMLAAGPLIRPNDKEYGLADDVLSRQSAYRIVRRVGRRHGIDKLSPHDCRHNWATRAARKGTAAFDLRDAGGWSSLAMPSRYVEQAEIANRGVRL